jgi:hypothetical protein
MRASLAPIISALPRSIQELLRRKVKVKVRSLSPPEQEWILSSRFSAPVKAGKVL